MQHFKLIIAIMLSVAIVQLHGSCSPRFIPGGIHASNDTHAKEQLTKAIDKLYEGPVKDFIKDTNSEQNYFHDYAKYLHEELEGSRNCLNEKNSDITVTSEYVYQLLQQYKESDLHDTQIAGSDSFVQLEGLCKEIKDQ